MAKLGKSKKQPLAQRITSALDIAQEEINSLLPVVQQETLVPSVKSPEVLVESAPRINKDTKDDYEFARTNIHGLLQKGNKILNGITDLAKESDSPRTFEVAGNIIKILIEGTRELMVLQKNIQELEKNNINPIDSNTNVTVEHADSVNNMMIEGTTMEMLEMLDELKRKKLQAQAEKG
jgi:transcriptional regulator of heat shock response